jgi:hypothetical protein
VQCTESLQTSSLLDRRRPSKVSIKERKAGVSEGIATSRPTYTSHLESLLT